MKCLESGMLRGRPYGGITTLFLKKLRKDFVTICSTEHYTLHRVYDYIVFNVYFPCVGTTDRLVITENLLADILSWRDIYCECECIIAGDFNTSLDRSDPIAGRIVKFIQDCSFRRCDDLFPLQKKDTSEEQSCIDYVSFYKL